MSEKKKLDTKLVGTLAPYIGLVFAIVIFGILTGGQLFSTVNLQSLSNQIIVTALATIGAVFVFGAGYFDVSLGGSICFAANIGCLAAIATGSLVVGAIVILLVSLAFGLAKGIFAATVNVPFFIFTVVLGSVLSSAVLVILNGTASIYLSDAVKEIPTFTFAQITIINVVCLLIYFVAGVILFNYTSLGIRVKNMGGNMVAARQSGINTKATVIISFIYSSIGLAIAAFLILIRTRTVGGSTAGSVGNDVMVALVLGGMPLSGGPRSKISAGIIGAATITILNSGLAIMGLTTGQIQICRGIVFIVVVFLSSFSYRGKLLPR